MPRAEHLEKITDELCAAYAANKAKLSKLKAKPRSEEWLERTRELIRPHAEKMARVIADWDVDPDVVMAAAFARAKSNRHPNGPFPNMLHSEKYLTQSLSDYFDLPYEDVAEKKSSAVWLRRMEDDLRVTAKMAERVSPLRLSGRPPEHRFILCLESLDMAGIRALAVETLEAAGNDYRIEKWLAKKNVTLDGLASIVLQSKKTHG
jgi:hypothetical protein